ncbi:MAG: glycosyltransferase [Roseburia sp.]
MCAQGKKDKVLVFSSREICYMSSRFFANQIGAAFEELGFETEICELDDEDDLDERLMPYIGGKYRLILDFNSKLPRMVLEDGTPYLDALNGPFFDYILDHPLFHHNGLVGGASNMHVLVLDEAQQRYVKSCYPKIKSVHTLPLGATSAIYDGEKEAECRILFPGTYDCPDAVYEVVKAAPDPLCSTMKRLIERRVEEPLLPMEEGFAELLKEEGRNLSAEQFALLMNSMYAVDAYIRDYFRKLVVDALLSAEIPITLMGEGWDKYSYRDERSLRRERGLPFGLSFERIAKAHILLNCAPIFSRGMHDRIPAGMANRAVVLTDGNPYLDREFADGKDLCFYSLKDIHSLCQKAQLLIENGDLRGEIAQRAYHKFEENHTWKRRAQTLLRIAEEGR